MRNRVKAKIIIYFLINVFVIGGNDYKMPPKAIADIVDAPALPGISISPEKNQLLIMERSTLTSIEELSQPELRLAGLRINPITNGRSRASYYTGLTIQNLKSGKQKKVKGLPRDGRISNISWSPDGKNIAMAITKGNRINLYVVNVNNAKAKLLFKSALNAIYGTPFYWLSNSKELIVKTVMENRGDPPQPSTVPEAPVIQENLGTVAPVRTYQDLLTNTSDEKLFEYYMRSQLIKVNLAGKIKKIGRPGIIRRAEPSPDGKYILKETIHRPFSYLVSVYRFPFLVEILNKDGKLVHTLRDVPLAETVPIGRDAVITGSRSFGWRSDKGSTIYYVEALDDGNPRKKVSYRDKVFTLNSPFNGNPKELIKLELRYSSIYWGDEKTALVSARKWTERRTTTWHVNPSNGKNRKIIDRSYEDRYNDPGFPMRETNDFGRSVLILDENGRKIFMSGNGASPEGDMPFVDEFDLQTNKS